MWNLINLNNFEIVKDFWNGRGDLGMDLDAWAKNTRAAAGRYMLVGNHEIDILTALKDGDSRNHFRKFLLHRPTAKFLRFDLHDLHRLAPLVQRFFL